MFFQFFSTFFNNLPLLQSKLALNSSSLPSNSSLNFWYRSFKFIQLFYSSFSPPVAIPCKMSHSIGQQFPHSLFYSAFVHSNRELRQHRIRASFCSQKDAANSPNPLQPNPPIQRRKPNVEHCHFGMAYCHPSKVRIFNQNF